MINEFKYCTELKFKLYTNMHTQEGNEYLQYSYCYFQNSLNSLILFQKAQGEPIRTVTLVFTNVYDKDTALTLPKYFIFLGSKTDKAQRCTGMISRQGSGGCFVKSSSLLLLQEGENEKVHFSEYRSFVGVKSENKTGILPMPRFKHSILQRTGKYSLWG